MNSFVQADIFFFITSIAVIAVSALLVVGLVYAIGVLRDAKYVMKIVRQESDRVMKDVEETRAYLRQESVKFAGALGILGKFFRGNPRRTSRRSRKAASSEGRGEGKEF